MAAGLIDIAIAILLLAALVSRQPIQSEQLPITGVVLWWITQLLPLITKATPGMLLIGLRLTDQSGGRAKPLALLLRPVMLILAALTCRLRLASDGRFMHDRVIGIRMVTRAQGN
jgi:uncharacterized RDD family membrane protein YckC